MGRQLEKNVFNNARSKPDAPPGCATPRLLSFISYIALFLTIRT